MDLLNQEQNQPQPVAKIKPAKTSFKYPNVLIMGESGVGKTRSIVNMPTKHTRIIMTEKSTLTFPNVKKFYDEGCVYEAFDFSTFMNTFQALAKDENCRYIVIDSFTGVWQAALKLAKMQYKGFEIWDKYALFMQDFLSYMMRIKQIVVVIAHAEKAQLNGSEEYEWEVVIDGKKLKQLTIAGYFELTLFAKKEYDDNDNVSYKFYTNALRYTPAKSPEGMLERCIENDMYAVVKRIIEYHN